MRILQISSARAFGGGERHFVDLADGLARRGHEVFAALRPGSPLRKRLAAISSDRVVTLPLRNALDLPSAFALARLAREHNIEIVHAHAARDYPLASVAARLSRARLVITRHVLFPMSRAHSLLLADASRVIAVSQAVARSLLARKIFPEQKIRVVYNGIDVEGLSAVADELDRSAYRKRISSSVHARLLVGTLGELSAVKGQEDFVRASSLVAQEFDDAEFVIIGEDNSRRGDNRALLEKLISGFGLCGRVHLLGRRDDAAEILSCLDVFVAASRSEAFGLATVEAMACGAAVVATETAGAKEIVEDNLTGLLVPPRDAQAIAASVVRLLRDENLRTRLTSNARRTAKERWSLVRMLDETEALYQEILDVN